MTAEKGVLKEAVHWLSKRLVQPFSMAENLASGHVASTLGNRNQQPSPLKRASYTPGSHSTTMDPELLEMTLTTLACVQAYKALKKKKRRRKRIWMKPWILDKSKSVFEKDRWINWRIVTRARPGWLFFRRSRPALGWLFFNWSIDLFLTVIKKRHLKYNVVK